MPVSIIMVRTCFNVRAMAETGSSPRPLAMARRKIASESVVPWRVS
jgi:hypothetical protein